MEKSEPTENNVIIVDGKYPLIYNSFSGTLYGGYHAGARVPDIPKSIIFPSAHIGTTILAKAERPEIIRVVHKSETITKIDKLLIVKPLANDIVLTIDDSLATKGAQLTIKDGTLEDQSYTSYRVWIESGKPIEHKREGMLMIAPGRYELLTSGGSVSFTYSGSAWLITHETHGNPRTINIGDIEMSDKETREVILNQ